MSNKAKQESELIINDKEKLNYDISKLYLNKKLSDVVIVLGDKKLYAHKVILASRSKHFEDLLYKDIQKSNQQEIIIKDASPTAFEKLLKYVYTGTIVIASEDVGLLTKFLELAHKYSFQDLEIAMIKEIKYILSMYNVCIILNTANAYDMEELKDACYSFMDVNASIIVNQNCLKNLTQKSMVNLLQRDSFFAPEVEIFRNVNQWCNYNKEKDKAVLECVRFSWMTIEEIVTVVRPSKLVDNEVLMEAIEQIIGAKPRNICCRGKVLEASQNIATPEKTKVIRGSRTNYLLNSSTNSSNISAYHLIDGNKSSISIEFAVPSFVNYIVMKLLDNDFRYYSYYIELSTDCKNWKQVVNYQNYVCRSLQRLYFQQEIVKYIKIVGTNSSNNDGSFHLKYVEAYFKSNIPKVINGIIYPVCNVATPEMNAVVIAGQNPEFLINGDIKNKASTFHTIGGGSIIIQLAQPYCIDTMKLLLFDQDNRSYRYCIETSNDKKKWEIVVDRTKEDCRSWQELKFEEKVMVYIKITGTRCATNNSFHCVHFECPAPKVV